MRFGGRTESLILVKFMKNIYGAKEKSCVISSDGRRCLMFVVSVNPMHRLVVFSEWKLAHGLSSAPRRQSHGATTMTTLCLATLLFFARCTLHVRWNLLLSPSPQQLNSQR